MPASSRNGASSCYCSDNLVSPFFLLDSYFLSALLHYYRFFFAVSSMYKAVCLPLCHSSPSPRVRFFRCCIRLITQIRYLEVFHKGTSNPIHQTSFVWISVPPFPYPETPLLPTLRPRNCIFSLEVSNNKQTLSYASTLVFDCHRGSRLSGIVLLERD